MDPVARLLPATPAMADSISSLVHRSFNTLAATDWAPEARRAFLDESSPPAMTRALQAPAFAAVEARGDEFTGFILMRQPAVLAMLFVDPGHLRQGVARRLWEAARARIEAAFPEVGTVELNATPYAFAAYRALGFVPLSTMFTLGGCRATRMACWLPARRLGAAPP